MANMKMRVNSENCIFGASKPLIIVYGVMTCTSGCWHIVCY